MIETPQVVETPAQLIATLHIETPRSKMQHVTRPGIREAMAAVQAQGIGPHGPRFAHHLKMTPKPVRLSQGDKWTGPFPFFQEPNGPSTPAPAPMPALGTVRSVATAAAPPNRAGGHGLRQGHLAGRSHR
jgi:hypothetical protein